MKDKLPVVGKRYKHKATSLMYWCIPYEVPTDDAKYRMVCEKSPNLDIHYADDKILDYFEELPNSNPQEVGEVDRALEELKKTILNYNKAMEPENKFSNEKFFSALRSLLPAAQNLANALEAKNSEIRPKSQSHVSELDTKVKQDISKPEPKIDTKEEHVEPVNIVEEVDGDRFNCAMHGDLFIIRNNGKEYYRGKERLRPPAGSVPASVIVSFINKNTKHNLVLKEKRVDPISIWKEAIYHCNFSPDQIWLYEIFINLFEQVQKDIKELKRKI